MHKLKRTKREILESYFRERDKLSFCIEVLDRGIKTPEKRKYYENYASDLNSTLARMEDENPFLVKVIEVIGEDE
jgi:hypothetical protein